MATILIVDDAPENLAVLSGLLSPLHQVRAVTSGQRALQAAGGQPRPDLILLDLNLPKYDGRQLLEQIKSDPDLSHIPVVILTTSSAEEDILRSYKLHANAYVTKPVDLDQFMNAVRQIDEFFVQVVRLPKF